MVSQKPVELRQTVASATLAYEDSFQETANEFAKSSFRPTSPKLVPYQLAPAAWQSLIYSWCVYTLTAFTEQLCRQQSAEKSFQLTEQSFQLSIGSFASWLNSKTARRGHASFSL